MNDYEKYVTEVNNIFSLLEKLKNSWTNNDNLSSIDETFDRFGYHVVHKFYNDEKEELIKDRYQYFQKYLEF